MWPNHKRLRRMEKDLEDGGVAWNRKKIGIVLRTLVSRTNDLWGGQNTLVGKDSKGNL